MNPRTAGGIAEADLGLGRMDVDVDFLGRELEEQRQHRVAVAREHSGIGAAHRADEQPVLHRAAVDEQVLVVGDAAVEGRQAGDPGQPHRAALQVDGDAVVGERRGRRSARRARRALPRPAGRGCAARRARSVKPISGRAIARRRTTSRQAAYSLRAERRNLRRAGTLANRFSTRTRVPGRQRGGPLRSERAVIDHPRPALLGAARAALERQPRDAGDRGQGLAAKAERGDLLDRVVGQLRGGVALERERDLVRRHPAAVVGHLDPAEPAVRRA